MWLKVTCEHEGRVECSVSRRISIRLFLCPEGHREGALDPAKSGQAVLLPVSERGLQRGHLEVVVASAAHWQSVCERGAAIALMAGVGDA